MKRENSLAVIITVYNAAKFIHRTIKSVLSQDYPFIEMIVVDDGSTDETVGLVKTFANHVRLLHHPQCINLGAAASRNLGILSTNTRYIAFLDHDDIWYPNKVNEQIKVFERHPEVGLVYTNGHAIDENDNILNDLLPKDFCEPCNPDAMLLSCYIQSPSSVILRRNLIEEIGMFDTNLKTASDHDLWIRASERTRLFYLPKYLFGYRKSPQQMSKCRKMWETGFYILEKARKRYPYSLTVRRKRKAVLHYRLGIHDLINRRIGSFLKNIFLAFIHDPWRSIRISQSKLLSQIRHNKSVVHNLL
jgi:glycosyltransferase involved in cell wall biosynthesis